MTGVSCSIKLEVKNLYTIFAKTIVFVFKCKICCNISQWFLGMTLKGLFCPLVSKALQRNLKWLDHNLTQTKEMWPLTTSLLLKSRIFFKVIWETDKDRQTSSPNSWLTSQMLQVTGTGLGWSWELEVGIYSSRPLLRVHVGRNEEQGTGKPSHAIWHPGYSMSQLQAKSSPKGNAFTSQCLKVSSIQKI